MSYFSLFTNIAKLKLAQHQAKETPHVHTATPLTLTQESAVEISSVPFILASTDDALIKEIPAKHLITAVGECTLFGHNVFNSYLSNTEGAFIQSAEFPGKRIETRIFTPYLEQVPDDWAFYLGDDGYIGYSVFQSKDEDGPKQYHRIWTPSNQRIEPVTFSERITDAAGNVSRVKHQAMLYGRRLGADPHNDKAPIEYLLVSAVETDDEASVNLWLGLDIAVNDLKVYPALSNA